MIQLNKAVLHILDFDFDISVFSQEELKLENYVLQEFSSKHIEKSLNDPSIKTDTGIEITFPTDYFENHDYIEVVNNPNGTLSIEIKNIGKITNK